jgi:hypothetical protein
LKNEKIINQTFDEMLKSNNTSDIVKKCIDLGVTYHTHLERWLTEFEKKQIFIIDSDLFKNETLKYLQDIQVFFELNKNINYSNSRIYKSEEVIFQTHPSLDSSTNEILENIFNESNKKLINLLEKFQIQKPSWLSSS